MQSEVLKVLIAASGSGGHLLPALYVAEELKKIVPNIQVEFCGSGRPLEEKLIGQRGYKIHVIPIVGVSRRGLLGKIEFFGKLPWAFLKTLWIIGRGRHNLILGVGGYISVLPIIIGMLLMKKTAIHEAERVPGMANRYLSYFADLATLANTETIFPGKVKKVFTGQPLNPRLFTLSYSFPREIKNILILGGSQGANQLDQAIASLGQFFAEQGMSLKHQCRPENIQQLIVGYQQAQLNAEVFSFSDQIPEYYQWADLIVTRSGLNTVRELELVAKPVVFVPLPKAPEQRDNAVHFQKNFIAEVVTENENLAIRIQEKIAVINERINSHQPDPVVVKNGSHEIAQQLVKLLSGS